MATTKVNPPTKANLDPKQQPTRGFSISRFTLLTVGLSLLLAIPAYSLAGTTGLEGLSFAVFLCLAPSWLVFFLYKRHSDSSKIAIAFLIGSGFRMACALAGFLYAELTNRYSSLSEFVVWLILLFMFTLGLEARETVLFLRMNEGDKSQSNHQ